MNLLCIIDNCFSCDVINNNYSCSVGFDDPDIDSRNCKYYALKIKCTSGLVFKMGEFNKETCLACMKSCASTGCPRYEKQKRVAHDDTKVKWQIQKEHIRTGQWKGGKDALERKSTKV